MPRLIAGNYLRNMELRRKTRPVKRSTRRVKVIDDTDSEEEDANEAMITQTFPTSSSPSVVRQSVDDLTCGMRSLQNLYGAHIVTREEMDKHAEELQKRSFGVEMYNKELGYYHVEVLKAVLSDKGKYVQRVDPNKIPVDYFHSVLKANPLFSGYIVALDSNTVKHYVAIRYRDGKQRFLDSLPGTAPIDIATNDLFRRRDDGHLYCGSFDTRPVVAILAVGGSPFVEYQMMHDTWSDHVPTPDAYMNSIHSVLQDSPGLTSWLAKWKRHRVAPDDQTRRGLRLQLLNHIAQEFSIVIKKNDQQMILQCSQIEDLVDTLCDRQWIEPDKDFLLEQDGTLLTNRDGDRIEISSTGSIQSFGINVERAITLSIVNRCPSHPQVGGFYHIDYSVQGKCVGTQHNAYSVRDDQGNMHVIYKGNIKSVTPIKR